MLRELVERFSRTITERRASVRRKFAVPVKVYFTPAKEPQYLEMPGEEAFICGETLDLSETGIGFLVPSIRIKEKYLVGQQRPLTVELEMAGKRIKMRVMGMRYERVGIHLSTERYLIGASIIEMGENERAAYEHFLQHGNKLMKGYKPAMEFDS